MSIIESNIPLPKAKRLGVKRKLPFYEMKINDSVFIEGKKRHQYGSVLQRLKQYYKMEFTSRECDNGIRFWRIK